MQRQFRSPEITYINPGMYRMMSTHACISDTKEETEDDGLKISKHMLKINVGTVTKSLQDSSHTHSVCRARVCGSSGDSSDGWIETCYTKPTTVKKRKRFHVKVIYGARSRGGADPGLVEHGPHDLHVLVRARHHLAVELRPVHLAALLHGCSSSKVHRS
jgi:hypothetical protein